MCLRYAYHSELFKTLTIIQVHIGSENTSLLSYKVYQSRYKQYIWDTKAKKKKGDYKAVQAT